MAGPWIRATVERLVVAARAGACSSRSRRTTRPRSLALQERLRAAGLRRRPRRRRADPVAAARAGRRTSSATFAGGMLFTADGLEQATRLRGRRPARAAVPRRRACAHVHDLGCGIGADAMAFAGLDLRVRAVDADERDRGDRRRQPAALAAARPTAVGRPRTCACPPGEGARHAGAVARPGPPHRRGGRRPRADPAGLLASTRSRRRGPRCRRIAARAARHRRQALPRLPARARSRAAPRRSGPRGRRGRSSARSGGARSSPAHGAQRRTCCAGTARPSIVTEADAPTARRRPRSRPLGDVGRVALRARPGGDPRRADRGADRRGRRRRAGRRRRLRRRRPPRRPAAGPGATRSPRRCRFNVKALRAWLRDRGVGRLTIKKRGVTLDADVLRRQLRLSGDLELTVVLTRIASQQVCLVVRPA